MSDTESQRDRMIAYTLIPWLTPARVRLLRETFASWTDVAHASATFLQTLLRLTDRTQVADVRDPLHDPERRRQVAALRAEAVTILDDLYPSRVRSRAPGPAAHFSHPQPRDQRPRPRHGPHRGHNPQRIADHRPHRRRAGPRGLPCPGLHLLAGLRGNPSSDSVRCEAHSRRR